MKTPPRGGVFILTIATPSAILVSATLLLARLLLATLLLLARLLLSTLLATTLLLLAGLLVGVLILIHRYFLSNVGSKRQSIHLRPVGKDNSRTAALFRHGSRSSDNRIWNSNTTRCVPSCNRRIQEWDAICCCGCSECQFQFSS
jgi:hypothetical protein